MIIQYYADSLGMPRPGQVSLQQRYIYLFQQWLQKKGNNEIFLLDRARGGCTIKYLYESFRHDEEYIEGQKDILIIHNGVVDCAPRPIPNGLRNTISKLPGFLKYKIIRSIHKNRSGMLSAGFRFYRTGKKKYEKTLAEWLTEAGDKFKRIYVINIAPTNADIENHSPGFSDSIGKYNEIIKRVIDKVAFKNIRLIDVHSLLLNSGYPLDDLIAKEDGHHITALGHLLYADELIKKESE